MIESLLNPVSIASLLFLISIFVWWIRIPTGLPPGPISIPLIGCLGRFDGTDISKTYREYRKRYGDVFSFKLGSQLYIVINGYEKIKEFIVQNGSKLSNRPSNLLLDQMYKHREDQMFQVIFDLYLAGTETTAMTILWTILIFVHNPKVQTKMRKEVLERIGNDRLPSLKDQHRMPYSQAVITEVHRYASVIRGIPRASVSDSYIGGYFIPKEALIYVNSESIHYDEDYFENPTTFKPERFLNKDGEFVSNSREFAFGTGKRACLGEILAQAELFLFLTSMLQKFNFEPEDVNSLPTMEPVIGISANPKQFNVRAVQLR